MRDELYDEFEAFYGKPIRTNTLPFYHAIEDALHPENKELNRFVFTDFYQELIRKDNSK